MVFDTGADHSNPGDLYLFSPGLQRQEVRTGLRRSRREMGAGEAAGWEMQILSPPHPARHKGAKPAHEGCALPGTLRQAAEKIYGCQCSAEQGHRHGA